MHYWKCWFVALLLLHPVISFEPRPYLLVKQVPGHSQLEVEAEGLDVLKSIEGPISPVVVIGPYRSGKSFLLNQLLGVSCGVGFGVGHTRDTQTKGVWLWGEGKTAPDETGVNRTVVFVDTEGFESTARSSSYDDRIFAVAAVLSSLLIYNLPETIRESDVSKLSFAVDLAGGFYDQWRGSAGAPLAPGRMLWVIQRDFLQGKGVQQVVNEALAPVPNPEGDKELEELNKIRSSLTAIAGNSTGYSLPQPHLDRTRLCELADSELDPRYLRQRDGLRAVVMAMARRKVVGNRQFSGSQLSELLIDLVKALNEKEIPTGASLLESFNQQLVGRALDSYTARMDALKVPTTEERLQEEHKASLEAAMKLFDQQLLGRRQGESLRDQLSSAIERERRSKALANGAASNEVCQGLEMGCTRQLDGLSRMALPSMRQFEGSFSRCRADFEAKCIGPARSASSERLSMAWNRARHQFGEDYNGRLLTGLLLMAAGAIVVFRFVFRVRLLEFAGWMAVVFLELYPKVYQNSMYEAPWWRVTSQCWEAVVALFVGDWAPLTWLACGAAVYAVRWKRDRRRRMSGAGKPGPAPGGGASAAAAPGGPAPGGAKGAVGAGRPRGVWWWGAGDSKRRRVPDSVRDLDV